MPLIPNANLQQDSHARMQFNTLLEMNPNTTVSTIDDTLSGMLFFTKIKQILKCKCLGKHKIAVLLLLCNVNGKIEILNQNRRICGLVGHFFNY